MTSSTRAAEGDSNTLDTYDDRDRKAETCLKKEKLLALNRKLERSLQYTQLALTQNLRRASLPCAHRKLFRLSKDHVVPYGFCILAGVGYLAKERS